MAVNAAPYQALTGLEKLPAFIVEEGAALKSASSSAELLLKKPCLICIQSAPKVVNGSVPVNALYLTRTTADWMMALSGRSAVLKEMMLRY